MKVIFLRIALFSFFLIAVRQVEALDVDSVPYRASEKTGDVYIISNAHLDTQWSWTVQTTINDYIPKTLDQNFALMDKYPDFNFNFEGAIRYMFAKEYYPERYDKLKNYIAEGRWMPAGGAIDASDVMTPSAESIIRNFLYGQSFFMKEFGIRGGRDIMLPDCFGFPYSLPTLGKHCGRDVFHTAKLAAGGGSPDYGNLYPYQNWQGVDGSKILAVLKPQPYDSYEVYQCDVSYDTNIANEANSNKRTLGVPTVFRYMGPRGDTGGAVPDINGQWMETSLAGTGPIQVHLTSPTQFYESFTQEQIDALPVWNSELPMKTHGVGCYTSKTILKYWNRKNELLADATEKSSYAAHWLGGLNYRSELIRDSWVRILQHQFHDDLTGTSLPKAYSYTQNDHVLVQLDLSKTLINAVGAVSLDLSTQVEGTPVVVYNPLSILREDIVEASIDLAEEPSGISVYNKDNVAVPAQITGYKDGKLSFIFLATVPSLGYEVYELRLNDNASNNIPSTLAVTNNTIENDEYGITVNANGDVSSIIDKKQGNKELLSSPIRLLMLYDNPGSDHAAWEIAYSTLTATPMEYVDENVVISIAEQGPLRSALKITREKAGSKFVQYIRMSSGGSSARIDFVNEVDWRTKERLLKVDFPLTAVRTIATFDTSIGAIERGNRNTNLYELNGHQWADLTNNGNTFGISILNDCKYGWDKPNNNSLRLTLIHTPKATWVYPYQAIQDIGLNCFTYSFYRHTGKWNETTQWEADKLNQPLLAFESPKHEGSLGRSFEFVKLNTDKVAVKALKKAENSDDMVIRLYELTGEDPDDVQITFPATILSAKEVNGVEEDIPEKTVTFNGNKISLSMTKFQPRTFSVKLAPAPDRKENPSSIPVELPYNIDVMSFDSKMYDGRFGTSNFAYPAELLSDEITSEGIRFTIGDRTDGKLNAIQCVGQNIRLENPSGSKVSKLYLLAASQYELGSNVEFKIDEAPYKMRIEYFADFLGLYDSPYSEGYYKKENAAFTATHRHDVVQRKNIAYSYLYMFKYLIPISEDAQTLTLPNDPNVIVFAATLSDNRNDDISPLSDITHLPEYKDIQPADELTPCGDYLIPETVNASGYTNANEAPKYAADQDPYTKWCDNSSSNKWLEYDFGKEVQICQWNVTHAGIEDENFITSDFALQRYDSGSKTFTDVDVVANNTMGKTCRQVAPFSTQRVRLRIGKAEQTGNAAARIYSFRLFGSQENATALPKIIQPASGLLGNYPNPFKEFTVIKYNAPEQAAFIQLDVYNITGVKISVQRQTTSGGYEEIIWKNPSLPSGIYFYTITATSSEGKTVNRETGKMIISL